MTVLKQYDSGTSQWIPIVSGTPGANGAAGATGPTGPAGSISTSILDDLSDTVITSASSGQVLRYDGTNWVNYNSTITLAGNLVTSGANSLTLTTTGVTSVTLPTSGTLVNTAVTTLSSLTSVGTLSSLTVTNNITAAQFYGRARDTEIRFFMEVI